MVAARAAGSEVAERATGSEAAARAVATEAAARVAGSETVAMPARANKNVSPLGCISSARGARGGGGCVCATERNLCLGGTKGSPSVPNFPLQTSHCDHASSAARHTLFRNSSSVAPTPVQPDAGIPHRLLQTSRTHSLSLAGSGRLTHLSRSRPQSISTPAAAAASGFSLSCSRESLAFLAGDSSLAGLVICPSDMSWSTRSEGTACSTSTAGGGATADDGVADGGATVGGAAVVGGGGIG
eukprot:scaffold102188_cov58-Phaeocystis_antarctica.AAC.1